MVHNLSLIPSISVEYMTLRVIQGIICQRYQPEGGGKGGAEIDALEYEGD